MLIVDKYTSDGEFIIKTNVNENTVNALPLEIIDFLSEKDNYIQGIEYSCIKEGRTKVIEKIVIPSMQLAFQKFYRGYKFRLYPNKTQKELIDNTIDACRFVWNKLLAEREEHYEITGEYLHNDYVDLMWGVDSTMINSFLHDVNAKSLQMTRMNLDNAYNRFFKKKSNKPKFKSRFARHQSFPTYNNNGSIKIIGKKIQLPKIGQVKFVQSRDIDGEIKSVYVSRESTGKYFVSFNIAEVQKISYTVSNIDYEKETVGYDLGIKDLIIGSDKSIVPSNPVLDKYLSDLCILQQKFSRTEKGSKRREKLRLKIARLHEKIANIRRDYINKETSKIVKKNKVIVTENLNIKGMMSNKKHTKKKRTRSRHIANASWCEITRQLKYKAQWSGKIFKKVERTFASTQLCSSCGNYKNTKLKNNTSIRRWRCPVCGTDHDRDYNAAVNIRNRGIELLMST